MWTPNSGQTGPEARTDRQQLIDAVQRVIGEGCPNCQDLDSLSDFETEPECGPMGQEGASTNGR